MRLGPLFCNVFGILRKVTSMKRHVRMTILAAACSLALVLLLPQRTEASCWLFDWLFCHHCCPTTCYSPPVCCYQPTTCSDPCGSTYAAPSGAVSPCGPGGCGTGIPVGSTFGVTRSSFFGPGTAFSGRFAQPSHIVQPRRRSPVQARTNAADPPVQVHRTLPKADRDRPRRSEPIARRPVTRHVADSPVVPQQRQIRRAGIRNIQPEVNAGWIAVPR